MQKMRKVRIKGTVQSARGTESGVVELSERDAQPLVDSGVAEWADIEKPKPVSVKVSDLKELS